MPQGPGNLRYIAQSHVTIAHAYTTRKLAVSLAERFNGEIINGDALQMYKGLPIATNKIPMEERRGIPHHLLGCVQLDEAPWTVHDFHSKASRIMEEIRSRGKVPVLVGGTHYYTQSLLIPNSLVNSEDRKERLDESEEEEKWPILAGDSEAMLEELRRVDPEMAKRWHPRDRRKIRRSLHIWLHTGRRASDLYREQQEESSSAEVPDRLERSESTRVYGNSQNAEVLEGPRDCESERHHDPLVLWTYSSPGILDQRLDERVESMVSNGLLDEVHSMHAFLQSQAQQGHMIDDTRGIWIAIGCKELLPYVTSASTRTEEAKQEGIQRTKAATRQYAKRQNRWIHLKLLHAMKAAGLERNMFLLDATDISQFSAKVEAVAADITRAFLAGESLPVPTSLSALAEEMLLPKAKETRSARYCDACDKTMMFEAEWLQHLRSKGHKNAMKPKVDWRAMYPKSKKDD